MGADLTAILLPGNFQCIPLESINARHIGNENRIHFNRQTGAEVHSKCIMGNQNNSIPGQNIDQQLPNRLGIGIRQSLVVEFPNFFIPGGHLAANRIKFGPRTGYNSRGLGIRKYFGGRDQEFLGAVVGLASLVSNICKNLSGHYLIPPLAFNSSINLSATSSVLPSRISAPSPSSGTK